jgi:hypothetical protein
MSNVQMIERKTAAVALTDETAHSIGAGPEVVKKPSARTRTAKRETGAAAAATRAKSVQATPAGQKDAGHPSRAASATTGKPNTGGTISKTDAVVKMLRAAKGATIAQIETATGWQAHSVRGFLSGTVRKKLGLTLVSETGKDGERRYRIVPASSTTASDAHAASAGSDDGNDGNPPNLADGDQVGPDGSGPSGGG